MKTLNTLFASVLVAATTTAYAQTSVTIITTTTDSVKTETSKPAPKKVERVVSDFSIYVGFNNLSGSLPAGYELRPIGSRFVALAWQKRIPLVTGGSTKLRLITGPEVAWNNFMFDGRNVLTRQNDKLVIEAAPTDLHKSKLVTTQLNLPLMLNVAAKSGFSFSVGAYAGMRLDSYTSVKAVGARTVRDHNSYNLSPVRWGFMTEMGFKGSARLFGRYEPNSLFRAGQGPDASVWSVGIKL